MPRLVTMVCQKCGSDDVCVDATARWNVQTQAWEVSSVLDDATCEVCRTDEAELIEKEIALAPAERPFRNATIGDLLARIEQSSHDPAELLTLRHEVQHRTVRKAQAALARIDALLRGLTQDAA